MRCYYSRRRRRSAREKSAWQQQERGSSIRPNTMYFKREANHANNK